MLVLLLSYCMCGLGSLLSAATVGSGMETAILDETLQIPDGQEHAAMEQQCSCFTIRLGPIIQIATEVFCSYYRSLGE